MSLRKTLKRLGRKTAKVSTKINRVAVPVISAGAGYFGGPAAAAAVTALGAQTSYYFRATQARNEGKFGRDARALGRGERKRVAIYGGIGAGVGVASSFTVALASGSSLGSALSQAALGQGGAKLILGQSATFGAPKTGGLANIVTAGNLASQKAAPVPGLVTQAQLGQVLAGGATSQEASAAAAGTSTGSKLLASSLGLLQTVGGKIPIPGTTQGAPPTQPNIGNAYRDGLLDGLLAGGGGGGGGGGDTGGGGGFMNAPVAEEGSKISPAMALALGLGALLLAG